MTGKIEMKGKNRGLSPEVERYLEITLDRILDIEKKEYHNDLVPFSQHAEQIRGESRAMAERLCQRLKHGEEVLKRECQLQEEAGGSFEAEASYVVFEAALKQLQKKMEADWVQFLLDYDSTTTIQDQLNISWLFMDRAYQVASSLLDQERYSDAEEIYLLLRLMNPMVFEYWFGEGMCQQESGRFQDALNTYSMSVFLQPENAVLLFQIANCLYHLKEREACLKALNYCVEIITNNEERQLDHKQSDLLKLVLRAKEMIELQKV